MRSAGARNSSCISARLTPSIAIVASGPAGRRSIAAAQQAAPTKAPAVAAPTATPKPAPTWAEVITFEGKSIKDTESFDISADEWRLRWETEPGDFGPMNFQIYVYKSNKEMVGVAANVIGEGSDSSVMRGKGTYYLTINTAQPYKIVVEQRQ